MLQYILQRILLFIPTLLVITLIAFGLTRLAPGDPAAVKAGVGAEGTLSARNVMSQETFELWRKQMHLDRPIVEQYVLWLADIARLDFGVSFIDNRPVLEKIAERLPVTLVMNIAAVALAYLVAIPLGVYSAIRSGSILDRLSTVVLFALYSLPSFWVATIALTFVCNPEFVYLFPSHGLTSYRFDFLSTSEKLADVLWHLALPMAVYTYGSFAFISRQMRSAMLETIRQDFIRTARAKGLSERRVVFVHAMRNSLIPIVTLLAGILPGLVGGSVIVETIFSIPGMGELSYRALVARDYPMVMAIFTLSAVLTLIGILLSDILYSVVDPRISYGKRTS
ncbi:MAG: ABC transporter permease [Chlorobi bacterium]|jgi:peptide/nickel transport system permease protein|nr:ABC transporter permease [Chlorobiota bacterium]